MRFTKLQNFEDRLASLRLWEHREKAKFNLEEFAKAGFFFEHTFDIHDDPGRLRCAYCPAVIGNWQPEDDPWKEHILSVEHCPHVVQYKGEEFVEWVHEEEEAIQDGMDYEDEDQDLELSDQFGLFGLLPIHLTRHEQKASNSLASRNGAFNQEMNNTSTRLSSFGGCKHDNANYRLYSKLAESGFYYEGSDESGIRARCFCCGRGLRDININDNDDVWRIHALVSDCEHVKKRKGLEFIQNIQDNATTERNFKDEEIVPDALEQSRKRKETDSFEPETVKPTYKRQRVQGVQQNDVEQTSGRKPALYWHKGRMLNIRWRARRWRARRRLSRVEMTRNINGEPNPSEFGIDRGEGNNVVDTVFLCCRLKVCRCNGGRGPCPCCLQDRYMTVSSAY